MPKKPKIKFETTVSEMPPPSAENEIFSGDKVFVIHLSNIVPSPFEPQARRRAKFKPEEIESLGDSIINQGLFSPIVVRPSRIFIEKQAAQNYEIVFGERRFLAHQIKSLDKIKCFVRELSDGQVLEMQYQENHQRNDNDPLDDAFLFKYLKERENYTDEDLAAHFAKSRREISEKLKLNDLIPEAALELTSGILPLRHAYYLAKFPASSQREIVAAKYAYKYHDRDEKAVSYHEFKAECEENILRRLADAPFSTLDPRLHIKNLICPDCPERTGFATQLFPELAKEDSCLNKTCFRLKTDTHLRIKRDEIAAQMPNVENKPVDEIAASVPLVTSRSYTDAQTPFKEKVLTSQILRDAPECEFSKLSLVVEGEGKGKEKYVCADKSCAIHNPPPPIKSFDETGLRRKQEEFERKVKELTRAKVFSQSLDFFTDYNSFWQFDDLIKELLREMITDCAVDIRRLIFRIVKDWGKIPQNISDRIEIDDFINSLDKRRQSQMLFLLAFKTEGYFSGSAQDGVKRLAKDYAQADYRLLHAEALVELAPTEYRSAANLYLNDVLKGAESEPPRFWHTPEIAGEENE